VHHRSSKLCSLHNELLILYATPPFARTMRVFCSPSSAAACSVAIILLFNFVFFPVAFAFPSGAGGCSGVRGSVMGFHTSPPDPNQITEESLAAQSLVVEVGLAGGGEANPLTAGSTTNLDTDTEYDLVLRAAGTDLFKGFLFRLSESGGSETAGYLDVAPGLEAESQEALECLQESPPLGGVTHTTGSEKRTAVARMVVPDSGNYNLQVTAVLNNGLDESGTWVSSWAHDSYNFAFDAAGGDTTSPTESPDGAARDTEPTPAPAVPTTLVPR